jgi:hypothetical protein
MSFLASKSVLCILLVTGAQAALTLLVGFLIITSFKFNIKVLSGEIFSSLSLCRVELAIH